MPKATKAEISQRVSQVVLLRLEGAAVKGWDKQQLTTSEKGLQAKLELTVSAYYSPEAKGRVRQRWRTGHHIKAELVTVAAVGAEDAPPGCPRTVLYVKQKRGHRD
jgi:hypothetical protein